MRIWGEIFMVRIADTLVQERRARAVDDKHLKVRSILLWQCCPEGRGMTESRKTRSCLSDPEGASWAYVSIFIDILR